MSWLQHEWRLLARAPVAAFSLGLLLVLTSLAVVSGTWEIERQRDTIRRLGELQQQEIAALITKPGTSRDAGSAAYYTHHGTWDPPGPAAFLALGVRDSSPYVLRVRALALQSQLHEGETFNPALAVAGRFDVSFVLIYLAPLVLIALLHDLVSSEKRAGRLGMLLALPGGDHRLWLRRAALRTVLAFGCLALPVLAGALVNGMPWHGIAATVAVIAAYLAFWSGLALVVAMRGRSSAANATALMGSWVVLTLVLPSLGHAVLSRAIPVHQGVDLMLAQRQAVHASWDQPPEETMERFFKSHPQWRNTAPLPPRFHWKWYYAFQQLGDESVAGQVTAYRESLEARQRWTVRLGWLLPGVGAQAALHRLADTDLAGQLSYLDATARFHGRLRDFYYPYLFGEVRFSESEFAGQPRFAPVHKVVEVPASELLGLAAAAIAGVLSVVWNGSHRGSRAVP